MCAPQQLRSVFLNLVINAAQAVDPGGNVLVATRVDGDHVVVSVADDGCGIPSELIDRIFDPFFTTKAVGEGTGLGLAIVHQIVASHGGDIQVESTPGRGTVFRVRLPAAPVGDLA
jgi:signal transduction histidine kinase